MRLRCVFILLLLIGVFKKGSAQTPPAIVVQGNQVYCGEAPFPIVTFVDISNPDTSTLDAVYVQIAEGYTFGQDVLFLDGSHPNITASWLVAEGKLNLQGPATIAEFEAAIGDVLFSSVQANFTEDKGISINLGEANYLPSTAHYYLYVSSPGITWQDAMSAAESLNYFGLQGYLATLTAEEEAQFAGEQSPSVGWIGASDAQTEGTWRWVTGPEAGSVFWLGAADGAPPGSQFSLWNIGEPNDFGNEDYAHITDPTIGNIGSWNDLPNQGNDEGPENPYFPKGFLVEFGGMPGDPDLNLSASIVIETPKVTFESDVACDEGLSMLTLTSNTPTVLWYDSITSTDIINSGLNFEVSLAQNTTFYVLPLFEGCNDGDRIPFFVNHLPSPDALDITIIQCDDAILDGLTVFNLNQYFEDITNGILQNRNVLFFENESLTAQITDLENFANTSNPQTIYAQVINTDSGCTNRSEITLQVNTEEISSVTLEGCDTIEPTGRIIWDLSLADALVLEGLPADAEVFYYQTYDDALLQTNELLNNFFNPEPYVYTIYTRVDSGNSCYGIGELQLIVNLNPNIETEETVLYCLNSFPETITLSGGVMNDIPNNYYYNWSTGETTIEIEVNEVGTYTVDVAFVDGCSKTKTINVVPSNLATIDNIIVDDWSDSNAITILVSGEGDYQYSISNSNGPYQDSNTFQNIHPGMYSVYIKDVKNDCGITTENVSVIGYPKYFTPNDDGVNDEWKLKGISEQFQPNSKVYIYDRFGKLLYTLKSPLDSWNGTFNGQPLPTNDYWFSVILQDGRSFKNHFTLKR